MNYANIAKAMGCHGIRVDSPEQIAPALEEALSANQPTVADVVTSLIKNVYGGNIAIG